MQKISKKSNHYTSLKRYPVAPFVGADLHKNENQKFSKLQNWKWPGIEAHASVSNSLMDTLYVSIKVPKTRRTSRGRGEGLDTSPALKMKSVFNQVLCPENALNRFQMT